MNLPKGTTIDGSPILSLRNHNDSGNPHAQYCKAICKVFSNATGYACIYRKNIKITSHCLLIVADIYHTILNNNDFKFIAKFCYYGGTIKIASIKGNENIYLAYKQNGNSFNIEIYIKIDEINDNLFIIPESDFYSSVYGNDYKISVNPSPLLSIGGFLYSATGDHNFIQELPNDFNIVQGTL